MSGGKKSKQKKRTYSEGELRYLVKASRDEIVSQMMYLFVSAVTDMFSPTEEQLVDLLEMVQRYNDYIASGLVDFRTAAESIEKKTGVKLIVSHW